MAAIIDALVPRLQQNKNTRSRTTEQAQEHKTKEFTCCEIGAPEQSTRSTTKQPSGSSQLHRSAPDLRSRSTIAVARWSTRTRAPESTRSREEAPEQEHKNKTSKTRSPEHHGGRRASLIQIQNTSERSEMEHQDLRDHEKKHQSKNTRTKTQEQDHRDQITGAPWRPPSELDPDPEHERAWWRHRRVWRRLVG
jgi:hypothetical protein